MLRMGGWVLGSFLLVGLATAAGAADTTAASSLSGADKSFMMEAAKGGLAEVQLGQLAKDKGMSDDVKTYGQKMVDDHSKANGELTDLAQKKGVTLPAKVDAKDQKEMDRLSKLSGAAFDKEYLKMMRKDHEKDVSAFKKEAQGGKDPDLTSWAQRTLPTLEGHLSLVRADEDKMKTAK